MPTHNPRWWPWALGAAAALLLIWSLTPILAPFAVGAALAYIGDPLADRLERLRLSRGAAVGLVFLFFSIVAVLLGLWLVPLLFEQTVALIRNLPDWINWILDVGLPRLGLPPYTGARLDAGALQQLLSEHWSEAGGIAKTLWLRVSESGKAVIEAVANLLLIPIVSFYLMRDWDRLVAAIRELIPPRHLPKVRELARESDAVLGSFIRGQLTVMAALATVYGLGLTLIGLKLGLIIGVIAGLLGFVPYLGFVVGIGSAMIAMLVQTHELLPLVWVAVVFGIGQFLESWFLTPILVGDKIGLHPVTVIFALLAGGQLFGFTGILIALPASAVLAVLVRHARAQWLRSPLYHGPQEPPEAP